MHLRIISRILGALLLMLAAVMLCCACVSLFFGGDDLFAFLASALFTVLIALWFLFFGKGTENKYSRRDGYLTITLSWLMFALVGTLPFLLSGYVTNFTDAFFESMAGFSTTGTTIFPDVELLPHALLLWRSLSQWLGGLGIVFFTVAVLPMFGFSGVQLFAAEATGYTKKKANPRVAVTARWILSVYIALTLLCMIALLISGMQPFEAFSHALTTIATGGFSTRNAGIESFHSPAIEWVLTLFMFVGGINYTLLYLFVLKGKIHNLLKNTEFRWYLCTSIGASLIVTIGRICTSNATLMEALRQSMFTVISFQTSTGWACTDYMSWAPWLWMLLSFVMYLGAMGGSSSGAMKCSRIAIFAKSIAAEFRRILHPNAVLPVKMDGEVVSLSTRTTVLTFVCLYILLVFFGWFLLVLTGLDFRDAYGLSVGCMGNIGSVIPAFTCDSIPMAAKWISCFIMMVGRLELFSVLLVFTPSFWHEGNF